MQLVNLTPHDIVLVRGDGTSVVIPHEPYPARVSVVTETLGEIGGMPLVRTQFGAVEGLPPPAPGRVYLVSRLVRDAIPASRRDVLVPADFVRDAQGRIQGCRALSL